MAAELGCNTVVWGAKHHRGQQRHQNAETNKAIIGVGGSAKQQYCRQDAQGFKHCCYASVRLQNCMGCKTLHHHLAAQGKGSRALLDSYCPITLLNSNYRLLAKALASKFGPALRHIIYPTLRAFVPGLWIGDSVLCHLENVGVPSSDKSARLHDLCRLQQGI